MISPGMRQKRKLKEELKEREEKLEHDLDIKRLKIVKKKMTEFGSRLSQKVSSNRNKF